MCSRMCPPLKKFQRGPAQLFRCSSNATPSVAPLRGFKGAGFLILRFSFPPGRFGTVLPLREDDPDGNETLQNGRRNSPTSH